MDRPIMNPWAFDDPEAPSPPGVWERLRGRCVCITQAVVRLAMRRPFSRRQPAEPAPLWRRLIIGALYRLAVVVILWALIVVVMLTAATHPPAASAEATPRINPFYYEPVSFAGRDGTRLEGWFVPALDAAKILKNRERALRDKRAAVVLVHDYGQSRRQMIPLIRPLHEAGFAVLAFDLRGCGQSAPAPQTFGLRESMDVEAAVSLLRQRPFVDGDRIAVVGIGAGANAAALAAASDAKIDAMVLQNPCVDFDAALGRHALPPAWRWGWVEASFRWTFGAMYRMDVDQLGSGLDSLDQQRVLRLDHGLPYAAPAVERMVHFLQSHLDGHAGQTPSGLSAAASTRSMRMPIESNGG